MIPNQYHCLDGGFPEVNGLATQDMLTSLTRWVERGTAPGAFSFPVAHPTTRLRAIHVRHSTRCAPHRREHGG